MVIYIADKIFDIDEIKNSILIFIYEEKNYGLQRNY